MPVDIHTHQEAKYKNTVRNIIAGKQLLPNWDVEKYYSIGIHPWYLDAFEQNKDLLKKTAQLPVIKAIGECGLDKNSGFPFPQQIEIFKFHIQLAEKLKKPLIIHCVKSYNELLNLKEELKPTVPWIIHGFNTSEPILQQCIQKGFYFSAGHQLFNSKTHIYKLIGNIPHDRLFLETDESILSIEEIYSQYSFITGIPEVDAYQMIFANFVKCFNII
jgi:TatD DNase family protein